MRDVLLRCLLATFVLAIFAGCGPGEDEDVVRIRLWHQKTGAERTFFQQEVERYNAQHDDHQVEALYRETEELRNLYVVAAVGGQGPELIFGPADNVGILALTETIRPIDDVLGAAYLNQFTDKGIVRYDGEPWLVADQVGNHLTFVYNRDLMPEPPETLGEMTTMLQQAQQQPGVDYGLTWNYREPFFFMPFLTGFGGWIMDEEGNPTLDTPETVAAIRYVLALRDSFGVIPAEADYDVSESLFQNEQAASIINGPWAWAGYAKAGIDFGLARLPRVEATGEWLAPVISAKGYSVNANVPEEKLPYVRQVLRHFTGPQMQEQMARELATIPVIEAVREGGVVAENPVLQASLRQLEVGVPMPIAPQMRQYWDGMRGPYQLVMNGAVTPEEGARLMQQEVEKRIADTFL